MNKPLLVFVFFLGISMSICGMDKHKGGSKRSQSQDVLTSSYKLFEIVPRRRSQSLGSLKSLRSEKEIPQIQLPKVNLGKKPSSRRGSLSISTITKGSNEEDFGDFGIQDTLIDVDDLRKKIKEQEGDEKKELRLVEMLLKEKGITTYNKRNLANVVNQLRLNSDFRDAISKLGRNGQSHLHKKNRTDPIVFDKLLRQLSDMSGNVLISVLQQKEQEMRKKNNQAQQTITQRENTIAKKNKSLLGLSISQLVTGVAALSSFVNLWVIVYKELKGGDSCS